MRLLLAFALCTLVGTGCFSAINGLDPDVATTLREADEFTLYSLDYGTAGGERFLGHAVLGKLPMPKGKDRNWLVENIEREWPTRPVSVPMIDQADFVDDRVFGKSTSRGLR